MENENIKETYALKDWKRVDVMTSEIKERKTDNSDQIETVLENLRKSEDKAINQLMNGEISVDTYCGWLVGCRIENDMS